MITFYAEITLETTAYTIKDTKLDRSFSKRLEMDQMMTPNLARWNSECDGVAADIFSLLDTNEDGVLNVRDLESGGLQPNNQDEMKKLAMAVKDRHQVHERAT